METAIQLLFLLLFVGIPIIAVSQKIRSRIVSGQRKVIEAELTRHFNRIFDPRTATIVREREEVKGDGAVSVHIDRIYRTPGREYFLFLCTSGQDGCLTHLSRDRVINALRSTPEILRTEFPDAV
jgi:hypothetical protein